MSESMSTHIDKKQRLEKFLEVRPVINGDGSEVDTYEGVNPLTKPMPRSRGVYGGNLCGQAIVVALETVPADFVPHSLHSYFVKAGDDKIVCQYKVEKLSDGRNFANRLIKVLQNNDLKYIVMISLTKKNSMSNSIKEYNLNADKKLPLPIEFQKEINSEFFKYSRDELPTYDNFEINNIFQYKFPPNYIDHKLNDNEHQVSAADRELSFWIRINDDSTGKSLTPYKYAGFGLISDSVFLSSLSRVLHLPNYENGLPIDSGPGHFFSVSLDHSIYFHDDAFEPKDWIYVTFKTPRFSNNRAMLTAHYYDQNGKLFASIVQEGLVFFRNGTEYKAKL
ncbi:thioesterase-like superfamily-domain-containing protein [Scheffersomyces coipomensis]|uniref:thioesterase-like superfamily-domain-containing protein n=1 Tax=Scheffersomyces coipomensis TaxID=1788519 RepID=UPI00315C8F8C